jgi:hypothetical protein
MTALFVLKANAKKANSAAGRTIHARGAPCVATIETIASKG